MKKVILSVALVATSLLSHAGGYLTNTNQNVTFLRNPAQDAAINLNGVYSNPAGVSFMDKGFHIGLNWQAAFQTREITSTFAPFAYGVNNGGQPTKTFKGEAKAPFVPSLQAAWVGDRWSIHLNAALVGGGGKAEYEQGLASFEAPIALIAGKVIQKQANLFKGYTVDAHMEGRQYYFGTTLGASYKLNNNWAAYAGVRAVLASAHYEGHLKKFQLLTTAGQFLDAAPLLDMAVKGATKAGAKGAEVELIQQGAALAKGVEIDTEQSGFGFAPILGLHYHNSRLDLAAKYEFSTRIELTNESENNAVAEAVPSLSAYHNKVKTRSDIPALLTLGARYALLDGLRLSAGYHLYFDRDAQSGHKFTELKNKQIDGNTQELLFGAEYAITPDIEVSAGVQRTIYPNTDAMMHDASFTVNSTSLGLGVGYTLSDRVKLNVAYFQTFYDKYTKTSQKYNELPAPGTDIFTRSNQVVGVGVEVKI